MLVSLIKGNKIDNHYLPNKIVGNYWIDDNCKKLINIEAMNGKWCLFSNEEISIIEDNEEVKYVYLQEYTFYLLKLNETNSFLLLYCAPIYDDSYKKYSINNNEITIGQSSSNYIYYNNSGIDELHGTLVNKDNKLHIVDNDSRLGIYVNGKRIIKTRILNNGDVIFIAGLKIIISIIDNNITIYVNNPDSLVKCRLPEIKSHSLHENNLEYNITREDNIFSNKTMYKKSDYIEKKHRTKKSIDKITMNIVNKSVNKISSLYIYIPMILFALVSIIISVVSLINHNFSLLIISLIIFIFTFIWPIFIKILNNKKDDEVQDELEETKTIVEEKIQEQKKVINNYLDMKACEETILNKNKHLWERNVFDEDFLNINIGVGTINAYVDEQLSTELEIDTKLSDMPIKLSLKDNKLISLIGNKKLTKKFVEQIILQLITFHNYKDVKFVILTNEENERKWNYLKGLPYLFNDDKSIRFFASNSSDISYLCHNIDISDSYYIIITDNINECISNEFIVKHINNNIKNVSLLILDDNINNVPTLCNTFIRVSDKESHYYQNKLNGFSTKFKIDFNTKINIKECCNKISNIPINDIKFNLPNAYSLLEMYNVGKVEQLNVYDRWNNKSLKNTLKTCVGINEYGSLINIDLQNKCKSTHALIVGLPGSGKTQFIITYILSMCINFNPNDIQFIILEEDNELGNIFSSDYKLPHLSGIFSYDSNQLKRFMMSFKNELTRRRNIFIETEKRFNEKYVDIDKYQELYNTCKVNVPISHIFIVIDEYDKLEDNHPKFVEKLIKISHISSDLGVHFIFSVDKNKMKEQDITNVFGSKILMYDLNEQYNITNYPGRFYLNNVIGQGANSDINYSPNFNYNKVVDASIEFIDNVGNVIKRTDYKDSLDDNYGKENYNVIKYLSEVARSLNIKVSPLCLDNLCSYATVASLMKGYGVMPEKGLIEPVVGEYEDLQNHIHNVLRVSLSSGSSIVHSVDIKESINLISSMLFSSMYLYSKEEVNYHIIDMNDNSFSPYDNCPLLMTSITSNQIDRIDNLFKSLDSIIDERSSCDIKTNFPLIVIIINDLNRFEKQYTKYVTNIVNILNKEDLGIRFVFSITDSIPSYLNNKVNQCFALKQYNNREYNKIFKKEIVNYPEAFFGRGLTNISNNICEIQVSYVNPKNKDYYTFVQEQCNECSKEYIDEVEEIKLIPDKITIKHVKQELGKTSEMVIGFNKEMEIVNYDFYKNIVNIISGENINTIGKFIHPLIKQFAYLNKSEVIVFNAIDDIVGNNINNLKYINSNFDDNLSLLERYINKIYSLYTNKNIKKFDDRYRVVFIYGMNNLRKRLNIENKNKLGSLINKINKMDIVHFIIIDDNNKLKNFQSEKWYKDYVKNDSGIWVGNNIKNQAIFKCSVSIENNLKENECYVINEENIVKTQYVESFDIIENENKTN